MYWIDLQSDKNQNDKSNDSQRESLFGDDFECLGLVSPTDLGLVQYAEKAAVKSSIVASQIALVKVK